MEKTSLKVHLDVKKTPPRIFPPRVNEYAKTLEKARLNMVETGWIQTYCWWIRNSKGADVWLLCSVAPRILCREFSRMQSKNVSLFKGFIHDVILSHTFSFFVEQLDFSKTTNKRCPDLGHLDFQLGDSSGVFTFEWFSHKISPWHVPDSMTELVGWPTGTQPSLLRLSIHIGTAQ